MVLWSQCLAMLRDFEGKCARLGQAIKQETDQVTGKRDLARLSHWFEAFGQQTGWCILCVHSKQCKTHVTPHILYPLSDRTHAVFHVLIFVSRQDVSPADVRRMTVHTPKRRIEHRKTNAVRPGDAMSIGRPMQAIPGDAMSIGRLVHSIPGVTISKRRVNANSPNAMALQGMQ